jgi:hypothetical protein
MFSGDAVALLGRELPEGEGCFRGPVGRLH